MPAGDRSDAHAAATLDGAASPTLPGAVDVSAPGAMARFTARAGGGSAPPYASLNLGPWTDDDPAAVRANHEAVAVAADGRALRVAQQVHEARVAVHRAGRPDPELTGIDAQVTDRHDLVLAALTADCLPVALLAPWGVGVAHAGWRGLSLGVISAALDALLALPQAGAAGDVVAVTGPCARRCCYEVGEEVHAAFAAHPGSALTAPPGSGPQTIDLPALASAELRAAGVSDVRDTGGCTIDDQRWFSHRRSGGVTGRQAGLVWRT